MSDDCFESRLADRAGFNLLSVFHSFIIIRAPFNISDWSVGGGGRVTGWGFPGGLVVRMFYSTYE